MDAKDAEQLRAENQWLKEENAGLAELLGQALEANRRLGERFDDLRAEVDELHKREEARR